MSVVCCAVFRKAMAEMILVHSPKGGVGTTTVAAQLALLLARRGRQVTAADLSGQGTLGLCMGGNPGRTSRGDGSDRTVVHSGARLLRIDRDRPAAQLWPEITAQIEPEQVLIVDIASSDREMLRLLAPRATIRLCVVAPDPATLATLPQALSEDIPAPELPFFVLNRLDDRARIERDVAALLRDLMGERLIGTIRRDEAVREAAGMMETLDRYAPASAALADFEALADHIVHSFAPMASRGAA